MKKTLTLIFFITASLASAHEFWMQPKKFIYKVGESIEVDFMVGENFEGQLVDVKKSRIEKLDHVTLSKSENILKMVKEGQGKNLSVVFQQEGTHLFVMKTNNVFMKLDGENFNTYLKEDGLDEILAQRTSSNTLADSASEYYSRCVKLLVQVGDRKDQTCRKEGGLPLEIVPFNNPYAAKIGDELKFRLLFQGKPLSFALIKVWNKREGKTFVQNLYTGQDGTLTMPLSYAGTWMMSSVKMVPSKDPAANWQSYWTSLVFGF